MKKIKGVVGDDDVQVIHVRRSGVRPSDPRRPPRRPTPHPVARVMPQQPPVPNGTANNQQQQQQQPQVQRPVRAQAREGERQQQQIDGVETRRQQQQQQPQQQQRPLPVIRARRQAAIEAGPRIADMAEREFREIRTEVRAQARERERQQQRQLALERIRRNAMEGVDRLAAALLLHDENQRHELPAAAARTQRRIELPPAQQQLRAEDQPMYEDEVPTWVLGDSWEEQPPGWRVPMPNEVRQLLRETRRNLHEATICTCGEEFDSDLVPLACGHTLCEECFKNHCKRDRYCPYCRLDMFPNDNDGPGPSTSGTS